MNNEYNKEITEQNNWRNTIFLSLMIPTKLSDVRNSYVTCRVISGQAMYDIMKKEYSKIDWRSTIFFYGILTIALSAVLHSSAMHLVTSRETINTKYKE